jgi:hypothetical protein
MNVPRTVAQGIVAGDLSCVVIVPKTVAQRNITGVMLAE